MHARPARRVLVVDDDESLVRACVRLLRGHCSVECAHSLEAALRVIRGSDRLDAVWSDGQIPDPGGGAQVLRAAAVKHPGALLLMVTGQPDAANVDELPPDTRVFHKQDGQAAIEYLLERLAAVG